MAVMNQKFYKMTMTLNNCHLVIKMLTKHLQHTLRSLEKNMGFYDTYSRAFEDFLSEVHTLSNAQLTLQIIDPVTPEIYLKAIVYDLHKLLN